MDFPAQNRENAKAMQQGVCNDEIHIRIDRNLFLSFYSWNDRNGAS